MIVPGGDDPGFARLSRMLSGKKNQDFCLIDTIILNIQPGYVALSFANILVVCYDLKRDSLYLTIVYTP